MANFVSVTQCLGIINRFGAVSPSVLQRAAEFGTLVHQHCLAYLKGLYLPVPQEVRPFFDSFIEWADLNVSEVIAVEQEVLDKTLALVGHVDLVARLKKHNSGSSVIDLKRTAAKPDAWVGMQLAAYQHLCPKGWKVTRRYALHAGANHRMSLIPFVRDEDWPLFLSVMSLYNYSRR